MLKSKLITILIVLPFTLLSQGFTKRISYVLGTSQGISVMRKEAFSNTKFKTYDTGMGYAYNYFGGLNITSKNKKAFSEIYLGYKSYSNTIKGIVDVNSSSGFSSRNSLDRYNYLSLEYRYSRYFKTIKDYKTFFSLGLQASYIINEKKHLNYSNSKKNITIKGRNLSNNFVITTTPTFIASYGIDLDKGVFGIGSKTRLNLDVTYDMYFNTPSNQYFGVLMCYKILF